MHVLKVLLVGIAIVLAAGYCWRRWRSAQRNAQWRLGIMEFTEQKPRLAETFRAAADATGKPRGLRWKDCELHNGVLFARDTRRDELVALVGVTISFEAIEGGGMEDVEAVGNLRCATAIFVFRGREWTTDGRAVFNLEPEQALDRFGDSLEPIEADSTSQPSTT